MPSDDDVLTAAPTPRHGAAVAVPLLRETPEAVLAILRSARSAAPDARLDGVLDAFRRHWLAIARRRYPGLADDLEDAVQSALVKLVSSEKLDAVKDVSRLEAWSRSLFVHTVVDIARDGRRHRRGRAYVGATDDDAEQALRDELPCGLPTPEEIAVHRERLAIVATCVRGLEVARLRFVEDLSEKEIAARQDLTRDGVAGQLKRIRRNLRLALGDVE